MKFNQKKVSNALLDAGGNPGKAMVLYIAENGCNGFRCKSGGCPLTKVCDHNPESSTYYAVKVMQHIYAQEQMLNEKKLKAENSVANDE